MDLTLLGVGVIVGNMVARAIRRDDPLKNLDVSITAVALVLIVGSRYHLFGT